MELFTLHGGEPRMENALTARAIRDNRTVNGRIVLLRRDDGVSIGHLVLSAEEAAQLIKELQS